MALRALENGGLLSIVALSAVFQVLTVGALAEVKPGPLPEYQRAVLERAKARGYVEVGLPGPDERLPDNITREEKQAGVFFFWRGDLSKVGLRYIPTREDHDRPIALHAARGEIASLAVGYHALAHLEGVQATFAFARGQGLTAPREVEVIDVLPGPVVQRRRQSYRLEPLWLLPAAERRVEGGTSRMLWLNFHIPGNASPGTYTGYLTLAQKDGRRLSREVKLVILPILLAHTRVRITPCTRTAGYSQAQFDQMKEHGIEGLLWFWRGYGLDLRQEDGRLIFDPTRLDLTVSRMKAAGMRGPMIIFGGNDRRDSVARALKEVYPQIELQPMVARRGKVIELGRLNDTFLDEKIVELFRQFLDHAKKMQYPPIMFSPFDEANERLLAEHHYRARLLKKHFPDLVIYGDTQNTLAGAKALAETIDVFGPNGSRAAVSKLAHELGKKLWILTGCRARMRVADVRFNLGIGPYLYDADGVTFWSYDFYGAPQPYNDFEFTRAIPSGSACVYPPITRDGQIVSTPAYEAVRVAHNDLRYLATLDQLLESNDSPTARAIRTAKEELKRAFLEGDEVETVPETEEVLHLSLEDVRASQEFRRQIIDWILALQGT